MEVEQTWFLAPPFRKEGTLGWVVALPAELHELTDNNDEPYRSRLRLREAELSIGPAHSSHDNIRRLGRGAYSFWGNGVYFSSTDGSDPNTNQRVYSVSLKPLPKDDNLILKPPVDGSLTWVQHEQSLRCAILGLGNRGIGLGQLACSFAGVEISWVVDPCEPRVNEAAKLFSGAVQGASHYSEPLADPKVDIVIVAAPDHLHLEIAVAAFNAGKHVFLEKPVATNSADARLILQAWQRSGKILQLGYVLRQAYFYKAVREVVRGGVLGKINIASFSEQLGVRHGASFMRRWHAQSAQSGGLMVHKGCHDLDIICWLLDAKPCLVSSFGGTNTFVCPPPAMFCSQCKQRDACPYDDTALHERRTPAEAADPTAFELDRCVFRTDKDIIDNQVVAFELDTGTRGTYYLGMHGPVRSERRITLIGDKGTLDGIFEDGCFAVTFTDRERQPLLWSASEYSQQGHGGGDRVTMFALLNACAGNALPPIDSAEEALRGLIFALAAEESRQSGKVVHLKNEHFQVN